MGFKRIFYNNRSNHIHLWETVDGTTYKESISPDIEYYIKDKTKKSNIKDIWGNPVSLQVAESRKHMREFIKMSGISTCEANIGEDTKFLQKRYKNETLKADINDFQVATIDIELESGLDFPDDIVETVKYPINLIGIYYSKTNELIQYGTEEYTGDIIKNYHYVADEKTLLEIFIKEFRKQKVDIITGWNTKFFDIPYIINRCKLLGVELTLSPVNNYYMYKKKDDFGHERNIYKIGALSILDGQESYKKFTYEKQSGYSLNNIGMVEVGEGKLDLEGEINHIYKTNWNRYVEYNAVDIKLPMKIEKKMKFIPLIVNLAYDALIPFENVYSQIALITGYILRYLHKKNVVLSDPIGNEKESYPGAYVMAKSGLYKHVMSFDVESMYPHLIMMYNISPETLVLNPKCTTNLIKTPCSELYECETKSGDFKISGIYYKKDKKGVLPEIIENIFNERKLLKNKSKVADGLEKKLTLSEISKNNGMDIEYCTKLSDDINREGYTAEYYDNQQLILKILINSFYGALGNPYFAFYNIFNAMAITIGGRHLIRHLSESINMYMKTEWCRTANKIFPKVEQSKSVDNLKGDVVILVDTDSNYLCLDEMISDLGIKFKDNEEFRQFGNAFDKRFLKPFFDYTLKKYVKQFGTQQLINFKREKIVLTKLILAMKKYADLVVDDEGKTTYKDGTLYTDKPKLSVTGIEMVRSQTPIYCRRHLTSILRLIMENVDQDLTIKSLGKIYDGFMGEDIENISKFSSVNKYTDYAPNIEECVKDNQLVLQKGTGQHTKAAIGYNYLVKKYKLPLHQIGNGGNVKYIKVYPNNELRMDVIGYIGKYPKLFEKLFYIDKESQWEKTFDAAVQRIYDVIGWGNVQVESMDNDGFIEFS